MIKSIYKKINSFPFFKNIGSLFILQGTGAVITFILQIYLIKVLGLHDYGLFVYLTAIVMPIGFIAGFGFNISLIKYINEYLVDKKNELISGIIYFSLGFTSLISLILTAIAILISYFFLNEDFFIYLIAFCLIPFNTTNTVFDSTLKAKKRFATSFIIAAIFKPLTLLVLILGSYFLNIKISLIEFLYVNLMLSFFQLIINIIIFKHCFPEVIYAKSNYRIKDWLNTSSPMLLSNVSLRILTYSDVIFIKVFLGAELVGLYNLMSKSIMLLDYLQISINTVKGPDFSQYFVKKNFEALTLDFFYSRNIVFFLTIIFSFALYFILPFVFHHTGNDFSSLLIPFTILIFSKWISAFSGPSGLLLNLINKQLLHMYLTVAGVLLYVFSGFILTSNFGLIGISIATLLGYGFVNLVKHYYALVSLKSNLLISLKSLFQLKLHLNV